MAALDDMDDATGAAPTYEPLDIAPSTAPSAGDDRKKRGRRPTSHAARRRALRKIAPSGKTGTVVPAEVNAARIGIGLLIATAGVLLLALYLPSRGPDAPIDATTYEWRFDASAYLQAQIGAIGLIVVGAIFTFAGIRFRPEVEVVCKRCHQYVMAEKDGVALKCPRSSHKARFDMFTIGLIGGALGCGALIVLAISMAQIVRG